MCLDTDQNRVLISKVLSLDVDGHLSLVTERLLPAHAI